MCDGADGAERSLRSEIALEARCVVLLRGAHVSPFHGNRQTQQNQEEMDNSTAAGRLAAKEAHNCNLDAENGWG